MSVIHLLNARCYELKPSKLRFIIIAVLILFTNGIVWAQSGVVEPQIVTAINENSTCGDKVWRLTLTVWNVGSDSGPEYAEAVISGYDCVNGVFSNQVKEQFGTFTGGPDGIATFDQGDFQFVGGKSVQFAPTGQEVFTVLNPEAFTTAINQAITSEYIYNTYGIRVQDSFGDDQYEQKSWSDQELILLNDVLKELPPGMIQKMAVSRIIRNKIYIESDGNPNPNMYGVYYACGDPHEKNCSADSGTIRIFDKALSPSDFSNDPEGHKEFKGTILHELTHALQFKKDNTSIYHNASYSPVVQNYMDAIRPVTNINDPAFTNVENGWLWGHLPGQENKWFLLGSNDDNKPPTNYGTKNPKEDLCESVMMYVYEPQKLKEQSMKRYNFIRDQIYGGIEYENGTQKKP